MRDYCRRVDFCEGFGRDLWNFICWIEFLVIIFFFLMPFLFYFILVFWFSCWRDTCHYYMGGRLFQRIGGGGIIVCALMSWTMYSALFLIYWLVDQMLFNRIRKEGISVRSPPKRTEIVFPPKRSLRAIMFPRSPMCNSGN